MSQADSASVTGISCSDDGFIVRRGDIMVIGGEIGPHVDIYELFNWQRLKEKRESAAAIKIQRTWRAYAARQHRTRLRNLIMDQTGMTYEEFLSHMIGVLSRVQGRYGKDGKLILNFNLKDVEKFLAQFSKFDKLFKSMAIDDQLSKKQFLGFFEGAGLFPTQNEVNRAFGAAFTGCDGKGELVFVLDSWNCGEYDEHVFVAQQSFIKDVVHSLSSNVGEERLHFGYVYTTENHCQQFGLTGFKCYTDVVAAIDMMQYKPERCQLAASLSEMNRLVTRGARPGAHRVAIVVSGSRDGDNQGMPRTKTPGVATGSQHRRGGHHQQNRRQSIKLPDVHGMQTTKRRPSIDYRQHAATSSTGATSNATHSRDSTVRRRNSVVTNVHVPGSVRRASLARQNTNTDDVAEKHGERRHTDTRSDKEDRGGSLAADVEIPSDATNLVGMADNIAVTQQLQLAAENGIQIISVDCPHCRYNASSTSTPGDTIRTFSAAAHRVSERHVGLNFDETMEVVYTLYPPQGSGVDAIRKSTWLRPIIGEREFDVRQLGDDSSIRRNIHKLTSNKTASIGILANRHSAVSMQAYSRVADRFSANSLVTLIGFEILSQFSIGLLACLELSLYDDRFTLPANIFSRRNY